MARSKGSARRAEITALPAVESWGIDDVPQRYSVFTGFRGRRLMKSLD